MATSSTSSTSSASQGILSSLGVGSGLDITSLVNELVSAERAPVESRLSSQASDVATKISAMAQLKGALSTFQTAVDKLKTSSSLAALKATSSDESVFTATATSNAAESSYDVEVSQLAKAQQLVSTATYASGDTAVGSGSLTLKVGSNSFEVTIDPSANTLKDIRDAINNASGNTGVKASLISGTSGTQLVLTGTKTGANNTISISADGGDGGLDALEYSSTATGNYTEKQAAQDAELTIAGIAYNGSSNTISDAIDGVTLKLLSTTEANSPETLTISNDSSTVQSNVQAFVDAYNTMIGVINSLDSYDADSQKAGALLGDGLLLSISGSITRLTTDRVSGLSSGYNSLATLGITTNADGTLSLDSTKYAAAVDKDPQALQGIFASSNGVASRLDTQLTDYLSTTGAIATRNDNLIQSQKDITTQSNELDARMEQVQARYTAQFTALDTLMSQLNSTSSYLDRAFSTKSSSS